MYKRWGEMITVAAFVLVSLWSAPSWPADKGFTQGVTKDSIKIGMFAPFTGPVSAYGKCGHMVEAIYRDVNEKGGINGRKLDLVIDDDMADPARGSLLARKQVQRDKVFMLHAGTASNVVVAMVPTLKELGVPYLAYTPSADKVTTPPTRNVFVAESGATEMAHLIAGFVKSMRVRRVVVVAQHDEWGTNFHDPIVSDFKEWGIQVLADAKIEAQTGDATAQVRIALQNKPEAVVLVAYPQPNSVFLRDAYAQGLNVPIIGNPAGIVDEQLIRVGRPEPVLPYISSYQFAYPVDSPAYAKYRDLLKKYYPRDDWDSNALLPINGTRVNLEVLRRMGDDLTWENWIKTMEGVKDFPSDTGAKGVTFKPFDPNDPSSRRASRGPVHAALNPANPTGPILIFPDWDAYLKMTGKK